LQDIAEVEVLYTRAGDAGARESGFDSVGAESRRGDIFEAAVELKDVCQLFAFSSARLEISTFAVAVRAADKM
jgi:hypothetical protein